MKKSGTMLAVLAGMMMAPLAQADGVIWESGAITANLKVEGALLSKIIARKTCTVSRGGGIEIGPRGPGYGRAESWQSTSNPETRIAYSDQTPEGVATYQVMIEPDTLTALSLTGTVAQCELELTAYGIDPATGRELKGSGVLTTSTTGWSDLPDLNPPRANRLENLVDRPGDLEVLLGKRIDDASLSADAARGALRWNNLPLN